LGWGKGRVEEAQGETDMEIMTALLHLWKISLGRRRFFPPPSSASSTSSNGSNGLYYQETFVNEINVTCQHLTFLYNKFSTVSVTKGQTDSNLMYVDVS
jgi:hypothetical protein